MIDPTPAEVSRRNFLKLLAAGAILPAGCARAPAEKIVPYARAPEYSLPGEPTYYATACALGGFGMGVLVENNEGRPTKVEGNPEHPASLGATDVYAQAAVLELWDPARSAVALQAGRPARFDALVADLERRRPDWQRDDGAGMAVLTGNVTSDSLLARIDALRARYPRLTWCVHDPLESPGLRAGARLAFGRPLDTLLRFDRARLVACFDADVFMGAPASVRHARDFATRRRPEGGMSRVFACESTPGLLGAAADERLALSPAHIERSIYRIARALGLDVAEIPAGDERVRRFEARLLEAAGRHEGHCLFVAGDGLSAGAHALVHALNHRLGGAARTVEYVSPVAARPPDEAGALAGLCARMRAGEIDTLMIVGGNPVYDAPGSLAFGECLRRVPWSLHLASHANETSMRCRWHVPRAHEFESWGDLRAFDGTACIVQPLIAPLHDSHTALEMFSMLAGERGASDHRRVRRQWLGEGDDEALWQSLLRAGVVAGSARRALDLAPIPFDAGAPPAPPDAPVLLFRADASARDGQFTGNAWLQELPRPYSKLTWSNAALMSPATARRLGVRDGSLLDIAAGGQGLRAPAWVLEEHADECVTLPLGYGRSAAGSVGSGLGFDAYLLRDHRAPWQRHATQLAAAGGSIALASTQLHTRMNAAVPVRVMNAGAARAPADAAREAAPSLYPERAYDGYRWGMSIDLNACIGCNACVIACQAENNIPVVGPEQVRAGREMHWLRVDRYAEPPAPEGGARTYFQPVPCMHCEHAPCEEVCPVGATVHNAEGLNLQVYNRCVGTRFCSQNCPYKVRRFNFLQYSGDPRDPAELRNPEVSVRRRGVMEKCTYCVQRITRARIESERLGRPLRDGEVLTACQAACPTQAIVFGDLNLADAEVTRRKSLPRDYALLGELNTRPRTTYLARVHNDGDADEPT
jgi:molybdopterin-containing oxidoreductase family iron-sulfur binding subunit